MGPRQTRGHEKRAAIARAAADVATERGFAAVSHRQVAARAAVPLGSTTYYFATLDDLLAAAAETLCADWLAAARAALEDATAGHPAPESQHLPAADLIVRVVLPDRGDAGVLNYYEQLLAAARRPAVAVALRNVRPSLESMLAEALAHSGVDAGVSPRLVLAVVDGSAVGALSEGLTDVAGATRAVVEELLAAWR